ncbi:MAG: hypothetical protein HY544_04345 [Candidatus Diapherotrites archaeon]|uniref:Uncharacterized protein n=1 Tax=Candidatus Iainarchaeum sp. TaxID=3101447 RepID=A0A8T3YN56_9ARCH|nr:hypothetical protein [Candidatus Diapherotrites archaeon]
MSRALITGLLILVLLLSGCFFVTTKWIPKDNICDMTNGENHNNSPDDCPEKQTPKDDETTTPITGGTIQITVKDSEKNKPISGAEVILYNTILDEVHRGTTDKEGKIAFYNRQVIFPESIKKLMQQYNFKEPVVYELNSQEYFASAGAQGYETAIEEIHFTQGKDTFIEMQLGGTVTALLEEELISPMVNGSVTAGFADPGSYYYGIFIGDKPPISTVSNLDGGSTLVYENGIRRTVSTSPNGSKVEFIEDPKFNHKATLIIAPGGGTVTMAEEVDGKYSQWTKATNQNGSITTTHSDGKVENSIRNYDDTITTTTTMEGEPTETVTRHPDGKQTMRVTRYDNGEVIEDASGKHPYEPDVFTATDPDGSKKVLKTYGEGLQELTEYDSQGNSITVKRQDREGNELSEEEFIARMEAWTWERVQDAKEQQKPDGSLDDKPITGTGSLEKDIPVNFTLYKSKWCFFLFGNVATSPAQPLKYLSKYYITGTIKGTESCSGSYLVNLYSALPELQGLPLLINVSGNRGQFKAGPFTADMGHLGGTRCGYTLAAEIKTRNPDEATPPVNRLDFQYKIYGCSDPSICPSGFACEPLGNTNVNDAETCTIVNPRTLEEKTGQLNREKQMSACMRYMHEDPCISPRTDEMCPSTKEAS